MAKSNEAVAAAQKPEPDKAKDRARRGPRLSQSDVPAYTLKEAIKVAEAIRDEFGKDPATPLDLAVALDVTAGGTYIKMITGAAIAYGLTEGGAQASAIALTPLGRRAVAPTEEGDDEVAMREAVLAPRVVREFLEKYDGSSLPASRQIALNVLEQMGVPGNATDKAFDMIVQNADDLGLLVEHKGKKYVRLTGSTNRTTKPEGDDPSAQVFDFPISESAQSPADDEADEEVVLAPAPVVAAANNKVFITHGKNTKVVEQIRKILTFGKFEAVQSTAQQSVAKPVPDKVMDDMRSCNAAIVHVGAERRLLDTEGNEHTVINPNVLIEIGAAMALYGRRFVLLVERGVELPSNLQGLYEVRYEGEQLDHDATMKLLEAFNDFH